MTTHDDEPLPQLQRALLDGETLDQLFFDVHAAAESCEIVLKGAATAHADETPKANLEQARELLLTRQVLGLQLRYRYQGREWWDTLLHVPGGIELVRMSRDF